MSKINKVRSNLFQHVVFTVLREENRRVHSRFGHTTQSDMIPLYRALTHITL
jgi:hypothetical protein